MSDIGRWQRAKQLFQETLERPAPERAAFLARATDDEALRSDVESLLASHGGGASSFLETPAGVETLAPRGPSAPSLAPGTRLGPYEIESSIGMGGMGEVYRARDVRLGREVAVKVLKRELVLHADRRGRFETEARAASALNHPNITAVYDIGAHEGTPFIVTELLEGQSLAERLAQGPLPVRKALECAVQVARGLAAAHEQGIVHRDLKPANLFLTTTGQVKILDFGVAKLTEGGAVLGGLASGQRITTHGMVLGTVGYMSPEQVRGEAVDARSDQFSLGCVLYELLTGREPFDRPTPAGMIAALLETEPPSVVEVNARVPRQVAWIVERCLAKDAHDRYGATGDLARDLELALHRLSELSLPVPTVGRRVKARVGWASLGLAMAATAFAAGWWARRETPSVPVMRYLTYSGQDFSAAAAPDGRTIAFSSTRDGRRRIWLKHLGEGSEVPLTAGEDDHPRFSPDGSTILFARSEGGRASLYRVASVGGDARKLIDDALYGDFSPDGSRIAFVRQLAEASGVTSLVGTAATDGSNVRELVRLDAGAFVGTAFMGPRWSPDGRWLAATQSTHQLGNPNVVVLLDVASGSLRTLTPEGAGVSRGGLAWAGSGQLVCSRPESVAGLQTSTSSRVALLEVASGKSRPLLASPNAILRLDVLGPGRLLLETRSVRQSLREVPLRPRAGATERWQTHGNAADRQPVYSPDGEWIAFSSNRTGNLDLWAAARGSGAIRRLTDDPAHDSDPAFMPDGRLLWSSNRSGHFEIWLAEADGSGARQVTHDGVDAENPVATPDGQWIVYASANPATRGIVKIRPDGSGTTLIVPGNMIEPEVSPDGRFIAFVADEGAERVTLRVARLDDGQPVFEIPLPHSDFWIGRRGIDQGRCRWLPDGRALAFILREPSGRHGAYQQDFAPGADTSRTRRRLAPGEPDLDAESLGVSPDGFSLTVSFREELFDLMLAEGVAGLENARRAP